MSLTVAMTAYNRPDYLAQTLQSWSQVRGFPRVHVRIEPGQPRTVAVAQEWGAEVVVNERQYGVLSNVWHSINDVMEAGDEFVVVAEDDCLVSTDIAEMMKWARRTYRADPQVLCVVATQRWWTPGTESEWAVRRTRRFAATVWATWADRWEGFLRDRWEHSYDPSGGWDYWMAGLLQGEFRSIVPSYARSQHIGLRDGAHMTAAMFQDHLCPTFDPVHEPGKWHEE